VKFSLFQIAHYPSSGICFCPVVIYSGQQILAVGRFFVSIILAAARTCQLLWAQTDLISISQLAPMTAKR
jgi:hypothetical protein